MKIFGLPGDGEAPADYWLGRLTNSNPTEGLELDMFWSANHLYCGLTATYGILLVTSWKAYSSFSRQPIRAPKRPAISEVT